MAQPTACSVPKGRHVQAPGVGEVGSFLRPPLFSTSTLIKTVASETSDCRRGDRTRGALPVETQMSGADTSPTKSRRLHRQLVCCH